MSLLVHVSIRGPTVLSIWQWSRLLRRLLELLLEPALAYVLLRAPVEERYRAHSLLDITDLQRGPIQTCLLAHQLSYTLALFFFAQVNRDRLLASYFVSYPTSYEIRTEAVHNFREWRSSGVLRFRSGDALEDLWVPDAHRRTPRLYRPRFPKLLERSAHRYAPGPYHGGQFLVGVGCRQLVAFTVHDPLAFEQAQNLASQAREYLFVGDLRHAFVTRAQALCQEVHHPQAHLGILEDEAVEVFAPHEGQHGRLDGLGVHSMTIH